MWLAGFDVCLTQVDPDLGRRPPRSKKLQWKKENERTHSK